MLKEPTNQGTPGKRILTRGELVQVVVLGVLTVITATTALRIEILNQRAGGMLPARELRDDGRPVTWRKWPWTDAARWHAAFGPRDEDGRRTTRPLTPEEHARMVQGVRRVRAANALRDVVWSWGLAQYVLVPFGLVLGFHLLLLGRWQARVPAMLSICVFVAAGALVLIRRYWWSLGE